MYRLNGAFLGALLISIFSFAPPATSAVVAKATTHRARVRGVPTFVDSTLGDNATFDDPVVRQAAIAGLGHYNGSVVAVDPNTGRILSIVNQKLAFSSGYIPCSTIKPVIAVAALEESVITRDTMIKVAPRLYLNLVEALAHSNMPSSRNWGVGWGLKLYRIMRAYLDWESWQATTLLKSSREPSPPNRLKMAA